MARTKGTKNKNSTPQPLITALPLEERLEVLASLIVERILDDQQNGGELLKELKAGSNV